jgi:hypothetical protein
MPYGETQTYSEGKGQRWASGLKRRSPLAIPSTSQL